MKTLTEIKKERPCYFVSINGCNEYECDTISECKQLVAEFVKEHKEECKNGEYDIYIGMYNITVCSPYDLD